MKRTNTATWDEKNKRWRIAVQKDNVRKNFYSSVPGRNGQREANRKADQWLEEDVRNARIRVNEAYKMFLDSREGIVSCQNIRNQKVRYDNHIDKVIGMKKVSDLCEDDIQEVINTAFKEKKLSEKSLKNIRGDLSTFLKFCRKKKFCTLITEDITIPQAAESIEKNILQPNDLKILFSVSTTEFKGEIIEEEYIYAFRFHVLTGLRPGELLGIKLEDIDFQNGYLNIQRSIDIDGKITLGKNKNARRSVPLTAEALALVNQQIEKYGKTEYLFNIPTQKRYLLHLKRYCSCNGLTSVTPYSLRHTFVSVAKSLPEGMVKGIVGHSKNMDTFGVYGHTLNGENAIVSERLQSVFNVLIK